MNENPPHDIRTRAGLEAPEARRERASYRPIPPNMVDTLRAMSEDERAEWLARNPLPDADRARIEAANRKRHRRDKRKAYANIARAARQKGSGQ